MILGSRSLERRFQKSIFKRMKISIEKLFENKVVLSVKNEDITTTLSESDILNENENENENESAIPTFSELENLNQHKNNSNCNSNSKSNVKSDNKKDYSNYFAQSSFQMAPDASELPMPDESFFS